MYMFDTALFAVPAGFELVIILLIFILLFGANRIPKVSRATGQALGEFQRGRKQVEEEIKEQESKGNDVDVEYDDDAPEELIDVEEEVGGETEEEQVNN